MPDRGLRLGLGGAGIGNLFRQVSDADASRTLDASRAAGMRLVDTAPFYGMGLSERRIGAWIRANPGAANISTKVGRLLVPHSEGAASDFGFANADPFLPTFDYSAAGVERSLNESRTRLGVTKLAAVLMHDLGAMQHGENARTQLDVALASGFPRLDEFKREGIVERIGIGVNEVEVCEIILSERPLDVLLLAGRYTLLENRAALPLLEKCRALGVSVVIGGVFNSGLLTDPAASGQTYNYAPAPSWAIARARRLQSVCDAHGVPLAAAALAFVGAHPAVETVLIGARSAAEVQACAQWADHPIPRELWSDLRREGLLDEEVPTP